MSRSASRSRRTNEGVSSTIPQAVGVPEKRQRSQNKLAFTKEEVIIAIRASRGVLQTVADALGCSRPTVHNYIHRFPDVKLEYLQAQEALLDLAEQRMAEKVEQGDWKAIEFVLRTKGKHRGYTERSEVIVGVTDLDAAIEYELKRLADERIQRRLAGEESDEPSALPRLTGPASYETGWIEGEYRVGEEVGVEAEAAGAGDQDDYTAEE